MLHLLAQLSPRITSWLTPLWVLGLGALGALAILALIWAILYGVTYIPGIPKGLRRFVSEIPLAINEGILYPVTVVVLALSGFGIVGGLVSSDGKEVLRSITRLPFVGAKTVTYDIEKLASETDDLTSEPETPEQTIPVERPDDVVSKLKFESNELMTVSAFPYSDLTEELAVQVTPEEASTLTRRTQSMNPLLDVGLRKIFVRNLGGGPGKLRMTVITAPVYSQVWSVPVVAFVIAGFYGLYFLQRTLMPKLSAIALSTYKSNVAQGFFIVLVLLGIGLCILFIWIPYNTMGEDIKMVKETGITLIRILAIVLAIWAASTSVADEIEGRTALTVLSKPIGRRSFVIGKFFGIGWTTMLLFILIGVFFLPAVAYKPIYDAKENSFPIPPWQLCHFEMMAVIPGLVLAFLEAMILAALSVAISTRLPMLINFVICFTVYALGHLTPLIVRSSTEGFDLVRFFAQFVAVILPNLDHFDVQAAVTADQGIPLNYLLWALVYSGVYSFVAMLLAPLMFEDRDLT